MANSEIRLDLMPEQVKALNLETMTSKFDMSSNDLSKFGVTMDNSALADIQRYYGTSYGMDAAPALQTQATITNPVQFFQYFAPEAVEVVTGARKIDDLVGRTIEGSFEDEEIVTRILERTGSAQPYTDTANTHFSSWNQNFEKRTICRFEEGLQCGYLESMRAAKMRVDDHKEKAAAVAETLAIAHNNIGFYGYSNGANKTYGLLNDPNLPAYVTVAVENGTTQWNGKTFTGITDDIKTAISALNAKMKGLFDARKDVFTLAVALSSATYLDTMNSLGTKSVYAWLKETYPNIRLEVAPELDGANGGSNVFYLYLDEVRGKKTFKQSVQDVMRLVGVEKRAKVFVETYASATAGVLCQYPVAVVRYTGI